MKVEEAYHVNKKIIVRLNDWMAIQILLLLPDSILFEYRFRLGGRGHNGLQWMLFLLETTMNITIHGFYHARKTKFDEYAILV